ncbi:MAG TPA: tetratricopeptide repeat protein [Anaerolineae bacterium]|nr:tetratricopeptide repeat protein [Anaerolineae bacterium]
MATRELTGSSHPLAIFQQYVLANLAYWQSYIAAKLSDTPAMDRSRDQILRGLLFAIELQAAWPAVSELIETLAAYMERRGYWEAWQRVLTQALAVAQQSNDQASVVRLSGLLARLAQRQSDFRRAVHYYRRTIHLGRRLGDRYNEARACSNLGYLYTEHGYWWRAELLCCHALLIFEQLGSLHGQAHTVNHLGYLFTRRGQWDQAWQYLDQACIYWRALGDDHGLMYGYINLGVLCNETDRPDEALIYFQKALKQADLVREEALMGNLYMNMGMSFRSKGELTKAEEHFQQAKAIFQRFFNSFGLTLTLDNLGLLYMDQRRWPEAGATLENALHIWRDLGHKHNEIRTVIYLIEYELARGDMQQASKWLKDADRLLQQCDPTREYHQLHRRVNKFRRSLAG